jgi:hypothetical protein
MRDIKKRYFYTPSLTDADFVALGITTHYTTQTPSDATAAQVMVETYLAGRHGWMDEGERRVLWDKNRYDGYRYAV